MLPDLDNLFLLFESHAGAVKSIWNDYFPAALLLTAVVCFTAAIWNADWDAVIPWARDPKNDTDTPRLMGDMRSTLSPHSRRLSVALGGSVRTDEEALSTLAWLASFFGGGCLEGYMGYVSSKASVVWNKAPPVRKYLCCFPQPLQAPDGSPLSVSRAASNQHPEKRWDAWTSHWVMKYSEDDKADAAMKKQGVPYIVRKVASLSPIGFLLTLLLLLLLTPHSILFE